MNRLDLQLMELNSKAPPATPLVSSFKFSAVRSVTWRSWSLQASESRRSPSRRRKNISSSSSYTSPTEMTSKPKEATVMTKVHLQLTKDSIKSCRTGQRARLLLWQSAFESRLSLHFSLCKNRLKINQKESGNGKFFLSIIFFDLFLYSTTLLCFWRMGVML